MAIFAITIQVDHDVAPEFLTKIQRQLADEHDSERIIAVHMENRHLNHLGDVGAIHRRARIFRQRGEADLVVDDRMHGSAGAVAVKLRHV